MKVLLVKTSSLGDLIHCMPAVQDLSVHRPDVELHWLVEEGFADIPKWHPFVKKSFAYADRRWRKSRFSKQTRKEVKALKQALHDEHYDAVVDAQGLIKSALAVRWLNSKTCKKYGYDKQSIREPLASWFYQYKFSKNLKDKAIDRNRALFAWAFDYQEKLDETSLTFGLDVTLDNPSVELKQPYAIFLHGTNWQSKVLPHQHWVELANKFESQGVQVYLPWSSEEEYQRASLIAGETNALVLDKLSLNELVYHLQSAKAVVGCDTGLSHIAGACSVPTLALYGASNSALTGLYGQKVVNVQSSKTCSPCMKSVCPKVEDQTKIPCYLEFSSEQLFEQIMNQVDGDARV